MIRRCFAILMFFISLCINESYASSYIFTESGKVKTPIVIYIAETSSFVTFFTNDLVEVLNKYAPDGLYIPMYVGYIEIDSNNNVSFTQKSKLNSIYIDGLAQVSEKLKTNKIHLIDIVNDENQFAKYLFLVLSKMTYHRVISYVTFGKGPDDKYSLQFKKPYFIPPTRYGGTYLTIPDGAMDTTLENPLPGMMKLDAYPERLIDVGPKIDARVTRP